MKLTNVSIRTIAPVPPKTEIIVFDDDLPGFGVRDRASGLKVYIVQYSIGNQQRRITLGNVGGQNIDTARSQAANPSSHARQPRSRATFIVR